MSSSIFECSICYNQYNDNVNKPLSLPCGHVFCEDCLLKCTQSVTQKQDGQNVNQENHSENEQKHQIVCPQDKKVHFIHPSQLPCCYAILAYLPSKQQQKSFYSQNEVNNSQKNIEPLLKSQNSNNSHGTNQINKSSKKTYPVPLCCIRHKNKKIKYICESDTTFLCSKCVIQHTGSGHMISEYQVDMEKIQSDFKDVFEKYKRVNQEAYNAKHIYESVDKKLQDVCHKQLNKLDITYKSMMRMLEQKRKELSQTIKEFYSDQKDKLDFNKQNMQKYYEKVQTVNYDLQDFEQKMQTLHYEELFSFLTQKSNQIQEYSQQNSLFIKSAKQTEKSVQIAVYNDSVKISDYGNIQYLRVSEYKSKHREHQKGSPKKSTEKKQFETEFQVKKEERNKLLALDDKVSLKLENIINKIQEPNQNVSKENLDKNQAHVKIEDTDKKQQQENNILLSSTTSINTSCLFNKNLTSSMRQKDQTNTVQKKSSASEVRGISGQPNKKVNVYEIQESTNMKTQQTNRIYADYEKGAKEQRRVTMIPQLRTDLLNLQSNRYVNQHNTQINQDETYNIDVSNCHQNVTTNCVMGSMTHRGEQLYERQTDYFGVINNKKDSFDQKQHSNQIDLTYSKYLNPITNKQVNKAIDSDLIKESLVNPFENGLFRQSSNADETDIKFNQQQQNLQQVKRDRYAQVKDTITHDNLNCSSDDEILQNMLQDIQGSKSQERRKVRYDQKQVHTNNPSNHKALQPISSMFNLNNEDQESTDKKLLKYTSNHIGRGHQRKQKKEHSKGHSRQKKNIIE